MSRFDMSGNLQFHTVAGSACNYHRIALPMQYMGEIKTSVPVLFYNRICYSHDELDRLRDRGYKVVIDIDDDVVLGPDHVLYEGYKRVGMTQQLIGNIQRADVVLTTNGFLADRLKGYNPNIVIVPNALPFDQGQFVKTSPAHGRKIVYACGGTHFEDLKLVHASVPRDQITIAGNDPASPLWTKIRSAFFFAEFKDVLPLDRYMSHYNGHSVAIAPLTDTTFNRGKSNLKALEAGAKGLAFAASGIHPYDNPIDRNAVLYANCKADWRITLRRLVDDPVYRQERGQLLAEHVRTHYKLSESNEIRRQVFESFR